MAGKHPPLWLSTGPEKREGFLGLHMATASGLILEQFLLADPWLPLEPPKDLDF